MCFYIGIEDLAANALIELMKKNENRTITYQELESYGSAVVSLLNAQGEKAILVLSRDNTNAMFRNYSDFFREVEENGMPIGISLKNGVSLENLIDRFRGYLALDVLLAFINENSIKVLGIS